METHHSSFRYNARHNEGEGPVYYFQRATILQVIKYEMIECVTGKRRISEADIEKLSERNSQGYSEGLLVEQLAIELLRELIIGDIII